jgi:RNA polymerase sigma factor (TIGR02999 family)
VRESTAGSSAALDRLVPLVYDELRVIARAHLRRERAGHTLSTTALVHEAYLRLTEQRQTDWAERAQFFAIASRVMRRVLVDHARHKGARKRDVASVTLSSADGVALAVDDERDLVLAIDEALEHLAKLDERQCRVVECRFFAGMTEEETAQVLGVTSRTVRSDWVKAKGWLLLRLSEGGSA